MALEPVHLEIRFGDLVPELAPLVPFAREVLSEETLRRQGFFRPETVARLLDDHVAGREDLSRQLWGLLTFTLWHEQVAAKPAAVAA